MRHVSLLSLLAISLAAACSPAIEGEPAGGLDSSEAFKSVWAFPDCSPTPEELRGTVNVIVPRTLDGMQIARVDRVNFGATVLPANSMATGVVPNVPPGSSWSPNGPSDPRPFDIFVGDMVGEFGEEGFVQVRVILTGNSAWEFMTHETDTGVGNVYGVGRNDAEDDSLCGVRPIEFNEDANGQQQARYVAGFYINLANLYGEDKPEEYGAPFTIALMAGNNTPILIDPKVWNDGATAPPPPPPPPPGPPVDDPTDYGEAEDSQGDG